MLMLLVASVALADEIHIEAKGVSADIQTGSVVKFHLDDGVTLTLSCADHGDNPPMCHLTLNPGEKNAHVSVGTEAEVSFGERHIRLSNLTKTE
jgi:hypothetical protein